MKKIIILLWVSAVLVSCERQSQKVAVDVQAESEKIMALSREWSEAAGSNDLDKIVSYWSDDAVMYSPGEKPVKGKGALRNMVSESFEMPGFSISWEPKSASVSESGDMAYLLEESKVTWQDSLGNLQSENSNVVTIWKKDAEGNWKCVVDISANLPN